MSRQALSVTRMPRADGTIKLTRTQRGFVLTMCAVSALLALASIWGWAQGQAGLTQWFAALPTMKANTAVSVLAVAAGMLRFGLWLPRSLQRLSAIAPIVAVALMGATLIEHVAALDLRIDQWLVQDLSTAAGEHPGRPSAAAALALLLLGLATLPASHSSGFWRSAAALLAFAIGYVASVGLLLGAQWRTGLWVIFETVSLPSAASIVMLSAGILSVMRWYGILLDQGVRTTVGARFLRGAIPLALILPIAIIWLQHLANRQNWWDAELGVVVAVLFSTLLLVVLAERSARWINRLEDGLRDHYRLFDQRISERTAELMDSAAWLRASEAQLAAVVETASTVIVTLNAEHRIVVFNREAERVFRVEAKAMLGQSLDRLLSEPSRAALALALQRLADADADDALARAAGRIEGEAQLHGLRAEGEQFPIAVSIARVVLPQAPLYTVVIRDLSDALALEKERTARQAAELADRGKSKLLSRVSHELRTPLSAIMGITQLMRMDAEKNPVAWPHATYLGHVEAASRQLETLIDNLLDLSQAEANGSSLVLEPVDATAIVRDAMAIACSVPAPNPVILTPPVLAQVPPVWADSRRLLQVLSNLLSNAIKFNKPNGTVGLALRSVGDRVAIDVLDTGHGMTREQQAHLFEPFNRLGLEQSGIPGSGIGLALCRQLASAMRGRIEVASQPGTGSQFTLWLMAADRPLVDHHAAD